MLQKKANTIKPVWNGIVISGQFSKSRICFLLITVIFTFTKRSSLSNVPDHPLLTSKGLFLLLSTCAVTESDTTRIKLRMLLRVTLSPWFTPKSDISEQDFEHKMVNYATQWRFLWLFFYYFFFIIPLICGIYFSGQPVLSDHAEIPRIQVWLCFFVLKVVPENTEQKTFHASVSCSRCKIFEWW